MPTLIGRFNEFLHQLSSTNSANSPTRQPPAAPPRTQRTVHRHASLSAADRPGGSVKRSHSTSTTKPVVNSRSSSSSRAAKADDGAADGHRARHRTSRDSRDSSHGSSQHSHSQRQSNQSSSSSRRESTPRRDSTSSILHHQARQQARQQLASSRRRHSIASVTSANGANIPPERKQKPPAAASHSSAMSSSKATKKAHSNATEPNNNNNNNKPVAGDLVDQSEESLASKIFKMKINGKTKAVPKQKQKPTKANKKKGTETTDEATGCFIYRYLNGQLVKQHPEIVSGKTCFDLPIKDIESLETQVVASCTGPNGGLLNVNCSPPKPFCIDLADEVDFDYIDEDYPDSSLSSAGADLLHQTPKSSASTVSSDVGDTLPSSENASPVNGFESKLTSLESDCAPIAGINDWGREKDFAYGISTTLYESHPSTKRNAGDPIADSFAVCVRENSAVLALADGVNWGDKACLASRCATYGCMDYLNKALYSPAESTRIRNTLDIFVALLRSFNAAHDLILAQGGHLTTLCAAVICQLKNSDRFIVCTCNVGDSLAYVYSPLYGVREITQESHDIFSMRDMRDALGALGPVSGKEPELNNLTVAMTVVDVGDIVFLTSDGISDNFDPVVGKFAMPKKETDGKVAPPEGGVADGAPEKPAKSGKVSVKPRKSVQRSNSNPERSTSRKLPPLNPDNYTAKGLPLVSAKQRHELTLLRMEDLIMNGVNSVSLYSSARKKTAKELCNLLVDFSTKLTMAKRHILEDPELYSDSEEDLLGNEAFGRQRQRRRLVGHKLMTLPGKLDHASCAAYEVGFYGSVAAKRASIQPMSLTHRSASGRKGRSQRSSAHSVEREDDPRFNLRMKATLARFESQDFLECCCESGPI